MRIVAKTFLFILAVLAAAALWSCSTQRDVYSKSFADMPEGAEYEFGPGYARYSDPEVMVEASYLPPASADVYFSKFRDGRYKNPFPPLSIMVFSLVVQNNSDKNMTFNPRMIMFVTEKSEPLIPKDFTAMYSDLTLVGAKDVEERMEAYKASCYDTSETIWPGESVHRLLVLARTDEAAGGGVFLFSGFYLGDEDRGVVLQYEDDLSYSE